MGNNILVISPHPDDEAIGCGGAIRQHVLDGDHVSVVFLTSGEKGVPGLEPDKVARIREAEAVKAGEILQTGDVEFWREPDGGLQANEQNVSRLTQKINSLQPATVYVTHDKEQHADHKAAALLVKLAIKEQGVAVDRPNVRMYEVWTPIQKIDWVIDISAHVEEKRQAIRAHKSQCAIMRFDEAIIALNRYRGEMHSWPGGEYAEIFTSMQPE